MSPPQSSSPLAPITMIPRSNKPRRESQSQPQSTAHTSQPTSAPSSRTDPSPAISGRSTPAHVPSSTSVSASTSASASSQPIATPSSPLDGTPMQLPLSGTITPGVHPLQKIKGVGASSSSSVSGLVGLGMTSSVGSLGNVGNTTVTGTPQTGASKMAAAAKRGQTVLIDGLPPCQADGEEEEDHPLSEKSLKARWVLAANTMLPLSCLA